MRVPLVISGMLMHLSIYALMMIHDFALLFIFIYGLFFTNAEIMGLYQKAIRFFRVKKPFLLNRTI